MRILHVSKYYYPYVGGVENVCKYIVDHSAGHEVEVICFNEGHLNSSGEVDGIKVYRVGALVTIARQAISLTYFTVLRRVIRRFKPDVIHFHWANPYPALFLLMLIPRRVELVIHWHMDIIKQRRIYPLIKPIETRLLKRADMVVVTSPQYQEGSVPLQPFKAKVRVVPNGIDDNALKKPSRRAIEAIQEKYGGKKIVFFVGRHIFYKGLPYLLEAEKHTKSDCVFVIAGDGPLTKQLVDSCHSDRVVFVGRLSAEMLTRYYYAASVFAFPSITKNEAFGMALAEAMYCYTPAVTFTIPGSGVNWVNLDGETGIEVPNGDVKTFGAAIDKLLTDQRLADAYAEEAHRRVAAHFTVGKMMGAMEKCYQELDERCITPEATAKFLQLVRYAVNGREPVPHIEEHEWMAMYLLANKQAILGVVFEAISRMGAGANIPRKLKMDWLFRASKIKQRNMLHNKRSVELTRRFRQDGFDCCILKGQGNALMYPSPYVRSAGDIDLQVKGGRDAVVEYVKRRFPHTKTAYQHVDYPVFMKVPVEVHYLPVYMNNPVHNRRLLKWFDEHADEMYGREVSLPDGAGSVSVPSLTFNLIFQMAHMMHHFFDEGIGLRHMIDYYYLLLKVRQESVPVSGLADEFSHLGLRKFAGAVMYVMQDMLGLEEQYLVVPADVDRGKTLRREILSGGNFGKFSGLTRHSLGTKNLVKYWRALHLVREYPAEALCEPVFRTWHFFWRWRHS